jgi:hypothetical protein
VKPARGIGEMNVELSEKAQRLEELSSIGSDNGER